MEEPDGTEATSRSEQRNAAARAALAPYEEGERPWPVLASSLVAFALGALTLGLYISHVKVNGARPSLSVVIVYTGLMEGLAAGTWLMRYGAVLAFQALLALGILGFSLAAVRATGVVWLLACLVAIVGAGYLFWKLVRVLGRIQVTNQRGP